MPEESPRYSNLIEALDAAPGEREFLTRWIDEDERETVTFEAFSRRARAQASWLSEKNVEPGSKVIVIMPQTIEAMATFAGAMMLGAVPAFLAYPNFKVEPAKYRSGLAGVSANLDAKAVVIDQEFPDDLLRHITLENGAQLLRSGSQLQAARPLERGAHEIAFIQHSAGTTGLQKGVALTHGAVLRQVEHLRLALQIGKDDRIYSWLPLYHDMGLIACFILPMVCHLPVVMQSPLDWVMQPESMLRVITETRCTMGWMPNFAFQFVPRRTPKNRWHDYDLSSLRVLVNCSEPVRTSSMREFREAFSSIGLKEAVLQSCYAMAENVFAVTQSDLETGPMVLAVDPVRFRKEGLAVPSKANAEASLSLTSSGRVLPGNHLRIVDDEGTAFEDGGVGEIFIQSDSLFSGYYNRPDLSSAAFNDGWYKTGDLGFVFDGELFVVGRKKDLLIIGGENLHPQDVEELVAAHPLVHDGRAVAMGIFNPEIGTEELVVVAEVECEAPLLEQPRVEQEIRSRIVAGLGISARYIFLKPPKWIVKSTAGKAARAATRAKLLQEHPDLNREQTI